MQSMKSDSSGASPNKPKKPPVITKKFHDDDDDGANSYQENGQTFEQMFEASTAQTNIAEGEVVLGRVVSIGAEAVLVDVGYKSEGEVPLHEFKSPQGEIDVQVGDEVYEVTAR
jgi:small subunit ribosomal protein S1